MLQHHVIVVVVFIVVGAFGYSQALAQDKDKKERTGTVVGELKSRKAAKNSRTVTIEILAAGEEKARAYFVSYNPKDPKAKEPFEKLLAAVNAAKIGDRVQCDWVNAPPGSEGGFFATAFQVLKKGNAKD